jgi:hypothetical protein
MFGLGLNVYAGEDLPLDFDQTEAKEEKKEEVKEEKKQGMTAQEKANMTLFANTLVEYLEIQKTGADLKSYWKSNQGQIDEMKVKMPDLYEIVLGKFKEAKEKANG